MKIRFFTQHREYLSRCLGGFLTCIALACSAGAADLPSASAEPRVAAPQAAEPRPVAPKPLAPKRALPAATPGAAPALAKTQGSGSALVRVADGRLLVPDIARIVQRGELVVAMVSVDTPPFFFARAGTLAGLEVEMAKEIASELKVKVRFDRSAKSFNEVVDIVGRQQADLGISKLSLTMARAQVVRFSEPYLILNHALVLNRLAIARMAGEKPIADVVRNFTGTIGVLADSSFVEFGMRNFPLAKIRSFAAWPDVIKAVSSGEITAAYRDEFEIKRILKSDPAFALTLRTVTLTDIKDTLSIAVGVSDPTLLAFVNQFLSQRKAKLDIHTVLQALENSPPTLDAHHGPQP
jgi:polar amino acid transport system substrate-binding protein